MIFVVNDKEIFISSKDMILFFELYFHYNWAMRR